MPVFRDFIQSDPWGQAFPQFKLGMSYIACVHEFLYLDHIIVDYYKDDADIMHEIHNLFYRTNMLILRFAKCSVDVKIMLFKSDCLCLYDKTYS